MKLNTKNNRKNLLKNQTLTFCMMGMILHFNNIDVIQCYRPLSQNPPHNPRYRLVQRDHRDQMIHQIRPTFPHNPPYEMIYQISPPFQDILAQRDQMIHQIRCKPLKPKKIPQDNQELQSQIKQLTQDKDQAIIDKALKLQRQLELDKISEKSKENDISVKSDGMLSDGMLNDDYKEFDGMLDNMNIEEFPVCED